MALHGPNHSRPPVRKLSPHLLSAALPALSRTSADFGTIPGSQTTDVIHLQPRASATRRHLPGSTSSRNPQLQRSPPAGHLLLCNSKTRLDCFTHLAEPWFQQTALSNVPSHGVISQGSTLRGPVAVALRLCPIRA